ncbi:MAG: hypothetical protein AB7N73_10715 [Gemmatimonadales bacterium]
MKNPGRMLVPAIVVAVAACAENGPTGPGPVLRCTDPAPIDLPIGGIALINPAVDANCLTLPGDATEREFLVVAYSGTGQVTSAGVSGGYELRATRATGPAALASLGGRPASVPALGLGLEPTTAAGFHAALRRREAALVASGAAALQSPVPALAQGPPTVGQQDGFRVCANLSCAQQTQITATARVVGTRGVIWVDNEMAAGADELTPADLAGLSSLFDDYLHPIDTVAFGATSDIDASQRIDIVITDEVNLLTPNCAQGRVVGYFFGGDLVATQPGSNQREVFFAFAPKPATTGCAAVTRTTALRSLPPVLIHELQHMISFNQRVLLRGRDDETPWLNEGLSHFAEELAQRQLPDSRCPASASCFSQFATGNLQNGYLFMSDPEETFLVAGTSNGPSLDGRGAAWLFLRWVADHFAADTLLGTQVTRSLLQGAGTGADNIAAATGTPFATLVGEWLLSLWADDLPGFPQVGRIRYRTWNLRATYAANSPQIFALPYPLVPAPTTGTLTTSGTLRAGTGPFVRVTVPAATGSVQVEFSGSGGVAAPGSLVARLAVARIR